MGLLRKLIRQAYRGLSVVNTMEVVLSGNPKRIVKHIARKRIVRGAGRLIK